MKRAFTILALILSFSIIALPQDFAKKGTWELGGTVGFTGVTPVWNGTSQPRYSLSTFTFAPEASYFVIDNFELGLKPISLTIMNGDGSNVTEFNFLIAPTYNFDLKGHVYLYIQALVGYGTVSSGDYSSSGFDFGIQGGLKIQVAKSSVLNFGLSYLMTNRDPSGVTDRNGNNIISLVAGFSVFITQ
jgi:hypothetical protein